VFSFNKEVLAFCHYWLAVARIEEGKRVLDNLKKMLPEVSDSHREKISGDLREFGERLGGISFEVAT